jgi:hypothetical protein
VKDIFYNKSYQKTGQLRSSQKKCSAVPVKKDKYYDYEWNDTTHFCPNAKKPIGSDRTVPGHHQVQFLFGDKEYQQ